MFLMSEARQLLEADLTAICEPIVYEVWNFQLFTNL
jgi:hypothetical protein